MTTAKQIKLTQGKCALVDKEWHARLSLCKWYYDGRYARRKASRVNGRQSVIFMHREILGISDTKLSVDHVNRDKLDNRRQNLRLASGTENNMNRAKFSTNTSGYKGVTWHKGIKKWQAQMGYKGKNIYIGSFSSAKEASEAYKNKARKLQRSFFGGGQ